ncbi:MAG TPA: GNAT family N-acetyltransferase [Vicinamibacterales bacterium]|nr:GNAT family N-acetyltransferase [Vicinamibacterales bacterium]
MASFVLIPAAAGDAQEIASLRNAAAADLTERFGTGHWSSSVTARGVLFDLRHARVYLARRRSRIVATLSLQTKKPWAIDTSYFTPCKRPLYLTNMAVAPDVQRQGLGRCSVEAAIEIARAFPADAIRLDAYDAPAGAGDFYARCRFREVGGAISRNIPLRYFEWMLS